MVTPHPFAFRALTPRASPRAHRVLLALHDAEAREGLATALLAQGIAALRAESASQALAALGSFQPEVALVDLELPDATGVELIRSLSRARPSMPVVVVSRIRDEARILAAIRAGAKGYVFQDEVDDRAAALVEEAARGGAPLSRAVTRLLLRACSDGDKPEPSAPELTPREQSVLGMLAEGKSYAEVGSRLGVSENTVRSHVRSLYDKLGVSSKTGAVMAALRLGLVRVP